jgi:hypothetical protein
MQTLLSATRNFTMRVVDFFLGTRLAPVRSAAFDSHLHWDRVVRAWR